MDNPILLSGGTFVKNMLKFSYCTKATIDCLIDYCDEVILNIGRSEDKTEEYLRDLYSSNPKVKMFIRDWPGKEHGTLFYRQETNFLISQAKGKWFFYLQGDECALGSEIEDLRSLINTVDNDKDVKGLLCRYYHFEGDFSSLRGSYPYEVRVIRNDNTIESWGDAQSFKIKNTGDNFLWKYTAGGRTVTPLVDFHIFHYGYVRPPSIMTQKTMDMDSWYHNGTELEEMNKRTLAATDNGNWKYGHANMAGFHGYHPKYMKEYIQNYEMLFPSLIRVKARFEDA